MQCRYVEMTSDWRWRHVWHDQKYCLQTKTDV